MVDLPIPLSAGQLSASDRNTDPILFAALALWSRSTTAWVATATWNLYLIYELGMKAEQFCTGAACLKRTPLYVVYPLLAILSLVALVQAYVHIRDKRQQQWPQ